MTHPFEAPISSGEPHRVVVVGGGAAGLAALSALSRAPGYRPLLLERHAALGGIWATTRYPDLATHIKSYAYRFHDFPPPETETDYATRAEVLRYFAAYVDAKGLAAHIERGWTVERVSRLPGGRLSVAALDERGRSVALNASFVVCALGFANAGVANVPTFPGDRQFGRPVMHSADLDEARVRRILADGERVVLLGGGKSAYDVAMVFHRRGAASQIDWVYREPLWGLNHERVYGDDPALLETMASVGSYLYRRRRDPTDPEVDALARAIVDSGLYLNLEENLDLHRFRGAHYREQELDLLRRDVRRHHTSIDRLSASSVHLADGDTLEADVLVCATGYRRAANLPPIETVSEAGTRDAVDPRTRPLLYRAMIDPRVPEVVLFTGENTFASNLYGYSLCAAWLPGYFDRRRAGQLDVNDMHDQLRRDDDALNAGVASGSSYAWIAPQGRNLSGGFDYSGLEASHLYRRQIHTDLGIPAGLQARLGLSLFGPEEFAATNDRIARLLAERARGGDEVSAGAEP